MKRVRCKIEEELLETEMGREVAGVRAECLRCGHTTESYGTGEGSRRRCLVMMREECPEEGDHYYVDEDAG
jgi:hypothetical protein